MARILIVEDDDHIRTALRLMFEGEGFDVDDAPTGEVGVALFARMAADVAIVDVMLPGMSGFETCQQLRDTSDLPIVIVSARDETVDVVLGLESGADDYVTKPTELHLTSTEFRLLTDLASMNGKVLSREDLLERVWGYDYFGDSRLVDVHIRRLRTKIEPDAANPTFLVTVRGAGYKLVL